MYSYIRKHFTRPVTSDRGQGIIETLNTCALQIHADLPESVEKQEGMKKLLEAQDWFLRAESDIQEW